MPRAERQRRFPRLKDIPPYMPSEDGRRFLEKTDSTPDSKGYVLQCQLRTMSEPAITRILRVPANSTLNQLHKILQVAFEWEDEHMYEFRLYDAIRDGYPPKETLDRRRCSNRRLAQMFEHNKLPMWKNTDCKIVYEYDMGDGWEHDIEVVDEVDWDIILDPGLHEEGREVFCVGGSGHPCEENCGGMAGWERLKDRGGFDPDEWDIDAINEKLLIFREMAKKSRRALQNERELLQEMQRDGALPKYGGPLPEYPDFL